LSTNIKIYSMLTVWSHVLCNLNGYQKNKRQEVVVDIVGH